MDRFISRYKVAGPAKMVGSLDSEDDRQTMLEQRDW